MIEGRKAAWPQKARWEAGCGRRPEHGLGHGSECNSRPRSLLPPLSLSRAFLCLVNPMSLFALDSASRPRRSQSLPGGTEWLS